MKENSFRLTRRVEVQIAGNQPAESGTSLDTFAGKIYVK